MKDDSREILNGLLADWRQWMQGYQAVAGHGTRLRWSLRKMTELKAINETGRMLA